MDRDLVLRAQRGDRGAFTAIADSVVDRFLSVAHRILRDGALAEDAAQQALLNVWRDLPSLDDPSRFDAWSHRLLVHACCSEARRNHHWLPNLGLDAAPEPIASDDYVTVDDRDELERGFRRLPVDQRAVIVLHHYVGLPLDAVAEVLAVPEGTVRSRLYRGMTALRLALGADGPSTVMVHAVEGVAR
jgi:RNA polymerase sigma-70 factor (ECF subfamily)